MRGFLKVTSSLALVVGMLSACCVDGDYWKQATVICAVCIIYAAAGSAILERRSNG